MKYYYLDLKFYVIIILKGLRYQIEDKMRIYIQKYVVNYQNFT